MDGCVSKSGSRDTGWGGSGPDGCSQGLHRGSAVKRKEAAHRFRICAGDRTNCVHFPLNPEHKCN